MGIMLDPGYVHYRDEMRRLKERRTRLIALVGNLVIAIALLLTSYKFPAAGLVAMIVANGIFFVYGLITRTPGFWIFNPIFAGISIFGIINWKG